MFNFYNQQDYPTGDWNADQSLMNRFSGSWLVDQMIKPYRAITWPFYKDRAFQMVYGAQNQGPESKKYFTLDAARKDYYSLVGGDWTCGGALGNLEGSPIFDFTDPVTKFKMLAYGCPSYSRSMGGLREMPDASSGFDKNKEFNLQLPPYNYGEYVMWHGAQFRGSSASQWEYWHTVLNNMGLLP
jgi:hypothetical protein